MGVSSSQAQNITSPNGNSLAVFVDGVTGILLLKDINGATEPISNYVFGISPFEYGSCNTAIQPIKGTNDALGNYAVIGGGQNNVSGGINSTVGGGCCNVASYTHTTIGGGANNFSSDLGTTVGGGICNTASSYYATIGGGYCNLASGACSVIGGGGINKACSLGATVGGGRSNDALAINSTISGGRANVTLGTSSIVSGGLCNTSSGDFSIVSGGSYNVSSCTNSVIVGGLENIASANYATIVGGSCNTASGLRSIVVGGFCNTSSGCLSAILGGCANSDNGCQRVFIIGSGLTASQSCTTFMNCASVENLTQSCLVCVGANKVLQNSPIVPNRGLFAQTVNSTTITATAVESSLIGTGVGSLSVPANGFSIGDSFNALLNGFITCIGTATIIIRVKTLTGVVLADTGIITLDATTNKSWKLELEFTIRTLGTAGVASISTGGLFSYIKNAGLAFDGFVLSTINTTTFDTTISNTLVITAQLNTNNAGNSIYSRNFVLQKIY